MGNEFSTELKTIGARLRELRKHRNLRLVDMEILCGIQDSKLSRIERGMENIEIHTVFKLAEALQVSLQDIFNYNGALPENKNFKSPLEKNKKKRK